MFMNYIFEYLTYLGTPWLALAYIGSDYEFGFPDEGKIIYLKSLKDLYSFHISPH